jgi:hypothetical protein
MPAHDDLIAEYLERSRSKGGGLYAVAVALLMNADATDRCATGLKYLGTGDAASTMGAIEFLTKAVKEGADTLASAIEAANSAD